MIFNFVTRQITQTLIILQKVSRNYNLFRVIKDNLVGHEYEDNCEVETVVIRWMTKQDRSLYQQGI